MESWKIVQQGRERLVAALIRRVYEYQILGDSLPEDEDLNVSLRTA